MQNSVQADKQPPVPRSLAESPQYQTHWRFLTFQQVVIEIQRRNGSRKLEEVLAREKDRYVRELLRLELTGNSTLKRSIEYALECHRSQQKNRAAQMISGMVVAGVSSEEIARELGSDSRHIAAYESIFFDVRRYLEARLWITGMCFFPTCCTSLDETASRWLITGCLRGWSGISGTFSSPLFPPGPAGRESVDRCFLALVNRAADFFTGLEIGGVEATAHDVEFLRMLGRPDLNRSTLRQLEYPAPLSAEREKKIKEARERARSIPAEMRRNLCAVLDRKLPTFFAEQTAHKAAMPPAPPEEEKTGLGKDV